MPPSPGADQPQNPSVDSHILTLVAEQTTNAVIVTDAQGRIEWVNACFPRLTGYTLEEVQSRVPGTFLQGPDTDPATVDRMRRALRSGQGFSEEVLNYTKDGRPYWASLQVSPIFDEQGVLSRFIAILNDISERRASSEALRRSEESLLSERLRATTQLQDATTRLTTLIASMQAGVLVEDEHRRLTLVNNAFCQMFGVGQPPESLVGTDGREVMRTISPVFDDAKEFLGRLDRILERRQLISDELVPLADGRMLERDYVPIFDGESYRGHLWLHRDITARVHDTTDLIRSKEAAEAATRAKSSFLATMSHEIRTPMNAVIGMTSLLLDTDLSSEQRQYAEAIRSSGDMLLSLINNILDFSKIESGHMDLEQQPFSLRACVDEVNELLAPRAVEKGLVLTGMVSAQMPDQIVGDSTRVRQILVNLVSNAIKFTHTGEVTVRVSARPDEGDAEGGLVITITVADTGIGIPPDRIDRLFRPFSQIDASTTRRFGGTGLGLAISRRLSELMGGTITVRSRIGVGSTFRVTFRSITADKLTLPRTVRSSRTAPAAPGRSLRVLVAEDNPVNQQVALRMLEKMGYYADLAVNGLEVLAAFRRCDYDVVLMDVQMPDLDGMDATRRLRTTLPEARQPYIIAVTANAMTGDREACLVAGMDDYISKPVRRADLQAALTRVRRGRDTVPGQSVVYPPTQLQQDAFDMLRESMGSDEEVARLVSIFLEQGDRDQVALRAAWPNSLDTVGRLAHRLKGSSLSLGAQSLADACRRLEQRARVGLADEETLDLLGLVEVEYQQVREGLRQLVARHGYK